MLTVDGTSGIPTSGVFGGVTDLEVWWRCESTTAPDGPASEKDCWEAAAHTGSELRGGAALLI